MCVYLWKANTLAAQQFHGEYRRSGSRTSTWLLTDNHGSESIVAPHIKSTITSTTSTTGPFPSPLLSPISRNSLVGCFKSGFTKWGILWYTLSTFVEEKVHYLFLTLKTSFSLKLSLVALMNVSQIPLSNGFFLVMKIPFQQPPFDYLSC